MALSRSIADQFRRQADWCARLGSTLYHLLLLHCADDCQKEGKLRDLLLGHENDPEEWALPLRLMGAVHRLVLEGRAQELSRFYPSAGGTLERTEHGPRSGTRLSGKWMLFQTFINNQCKPMMLDVREVCLVVSD